ncbi:SDR family NAD(P)-dependent oxidoreductase [Sphingomonas sp. SUN039]|uniref:SDR family NAD(P)-dependent oxidoreductase n=1 Tax=Sphingomonas sp. SUN039 TaxID=2937787 RepID=UPI0021647849|nr:SDR family oxidoreductase [Sphingomonas sp. SUN039]UVO54246.1 SDR family oxidoreductase [Sphingomonas sp. SUN039]
MAEGSLIGQVALVTGGGGGIGRAIALALAGAGADIVIADIVPERCDEVAARVGELGRRALPCPTDVCDTDQIRAAIATADREFGRLDILVNNAGGVSARPFADQSERSWRKHIDFNLVSLFAATSAAVPLMIRGGRGGAILNVTSIEGSRAAPLYAVYAACKAGMNNFNRTMALELGHHGIRVNAIAPDYTVTPGTSGNTSGPVDESIWFQPTPAQHDATARRIPLQRAGIAEECGQAALFLVSPASSYITGTILPVDGGAWASGGWVRDRAGKWVLAEAYPNLEEPPA